MSADLIKKYVMITEGVTTQQLNEGTRETFDLLDQLQEALEQAVDVARQLERDEILGGVVSSYTRPWLQAWISDTNQMGSVDSMRDSLARRAEEDEYQNEFGDDDDAEGITRGPDGERR